MNHLNNFTNYEKENELNLVDCKYRDPDYFKNLIKDFKRKALSFFHMNICSLTKNFDNFDILLSELSELVLTFLQLQNLELKKIHQGQLIFS